MSIANTNSIMRKIYSVIDLIRTIAVIAILGFIVTIGAIQIVMRYTPGINALVWVDEIMRYLNIWVIFLAASIGVKNGSHLKMDYFLYKFCSPKIVPIVIRITNSAIIISLILVIYFGAKRVIANTGAIIQCLPISISLFYAAIPVGGMLILIDYLFILIYGRHPYATLRENEE